MAAAVPVEIVAYDPAWPERFAREAARLHAALGASATRIDHVGSTSVPGLAAKDVIDIQVSIRSFEPESVYREPIEGLGYVYRPDPREPARRLFLLSEPGGRRLVNLHLCESGGEWEFRHLAFCDHLRAHPDTADDYERLKRELAPRFEDSQAYADAKGPFIRRVERRARPRRFPLR